MESQFIIFYSIVWWQESYGGCDFPIWGLMGNAEQRDSAAWILTREVWCYKSAIRVECYSIVWNTDNLERKIAGIFQ